MSGARRTRDWDAGTYNRVCGPQLEWSRAVIERLALEGDETVLDAGCGSGRVSAQLLARIPRGRLIAVDGSVSMAEHARDLLGQGVTVICSDLLTLTLEEPVDAVFSNATFHWIDDHEALFGRISSWLRPGGKLEAQCGGVGNIASFIELTGSVAAQGPFREHLADLEQPHHFAGPEETKARLRAAGFDSVRCRLKPRPTRPAEPRAFISSVCLNPQLTALPERLRDAFVDAVMAQFEADPVLGYVRLDISARRAGASTA